MENKIKPFGVFILIEGPDTAGKSTQTQLLKEKLEEEGKTVELLHFPDYNSSFGKMIQEYLKGQLSDSTFEQFLAVQMVYIADQLAAQEKIQDLIQSGTWVIADRYDLSTLAYTSARLDLDSSVLIETFNGLLKKGILKHIAQMQDVLLKPDVTFILDLPYEEIKKRKQELDGFESNDRFMEEVAKAYTLLATNPLGQERAIIKLDATQTIEELHKEILNHAKQFDRIYTTLRTICEREGIACN